MLGLYAVYVRGRAVRVVAIVVARLDDADVGLCNGRLLGKFLLEVVERHVQIAVEEPAHESEGKHVAALEHCLGLHATIGKAVLDHLCDGARDDAVGIDTHLSQGIFGLEGRLLQVARAERVGVDDDGGI